MHTLAVEVVPVSLLQAGQHRLESLARSSGFSESETENMGRIFAHLLGPTVGSLPSDDPPWLSDVSDDHSPYEFSIVLGGHKPEVRLLVERREDFTLESNRVEGAALTHEIFQRYGAGRRRYQALESMFLGEGEAKEGVFAIWHAVSFWPGEKPEFKIYLNLHGRGADRAAAMAEEAFDRLGLAHHWPAIVENAMRRGPGKDLPMYLSIDLDDDPEARTKLYFRHFEATAADLEATFQGVADYQPGRVTELCRAITGSEGPFSKKAPISCQIFLDTERAQAASGTFYFPVAAYVSDDRTIRDRVVAYLQSQKLPAMLYAGAIEAFARRPLESGIGMQSYVSTRPTSTSSRVTLYFSPETFSVRLPNMNIQAVTPSSVSTPPVTGFLASAPTCDELVAYHEAHDISHHPYFERMGREPVDLGKLWRLMANFHEAIVQHFPRRLAALTARVTDDAVRSILAKQLNDEMGDGKFERAHRGLFRRILTALEPYRPADSHGDALAAGRLLGEALEHAYVQAPLTFALGASIVVEIYGKQVDTRVGAEFRRQTQLDKKTLEWLHLHEALEVDHAGESLELGRMLPSDEASRVSAAAGAQSIADAAWKFFDALYAQSF